MIVPIGVLMGMVSSILSLSIIRYGRGFGKSRFLKGWLSSCGLHGRILALDNLMLRGLPLANRYCMCCCNEESMDHLFIHCPVAYSLWVQMLQVFGIQWIMPGSVESLVSCCCCNWLGKFSLDIWNMVPSCLMWVVWLERNRPSFEALERMLDQLQALNQNTLFE